MMMHLYDSQVGVYFLGFFFLCEFFSCFFFDLILAGGFSEDYFQNRCDTQNWLTEFKKQVCSVTQVKVQNQDDLCSDPNNFC